jgi:hypothetical protein
MNWIVLGLYIAGFVGILSIPSGRYALFRIVTFESLRERDAASRQRSHGIELGEPPWARDIADVLWDEQLTATEEFITRTDRELNREQWARIPAGPAVASAPCGGSSGGHGYACQDQA